eukprot:1408967-Rhodomonas_salina.3
MALLRRSNFTSASYHNAPTSVPPDPDVSTTKPQRQYHQTPTSVQQHTSTSVLERQYNGRARQDQPAYPDVSTHNGTDSTTTSMPVVYLALREHGRYSR